MFWNSRLPGPTVTIVPGGMVDVVSTNMKGNWTLPPGAMLWFGKKDPLIPSKYGDARPSTPSIKKKKLAPASAIFPPKTAVWDETLVNMPSTITLSPGLNVGSVVTTNSKSEAMNEAGASRGNANRQAAIPGRTNSAFNLTLVLPKLPE